MLMASFNPATGSGSTNVTTIIHTDHQGSTNVTSDKDGNLAQLATYYPFGGKRNNELPSSGIRESRLYVGQYDDQASNLDYMNARYYDATRGQFTSEDPVFNRNPAKQQLANPQSFNSYSYANNNPINLSDPSGEATAKAAAAPAQGNFTSASPAFFAWAYSALSYIQQNIATLSSSPAYSAGGGAGGGGGKSYTAPGPGMDAFAKAVIDPVGAVMSLGRSSPVSAYGGTAAGIPLGAIGMFAGPGEARAVGGAMGEVVPLYRAVKLKELEDIKNLKGGFRIPTGNNEVKYFTTSKEGLVKWAGDDSARYGESNIIIETSIPRSGLSAPGVSVMEVDGGLPAVMLPTEILPLLSKATW